MRGKEECATDRDPWLGRPLSGSKLHASVTASRDINTDDMLSRQSSVTARCQEYTALHRCVSPEGRGCNAVRTQLQSSTRVPVPARIVSQKDSLSTGHRPGVSSPNVYIPLWK